MNHVYVLSNQEHEYLEKSGDWSRGEDSRSLYRTPHKDEALNQMVELSVKNPTLRIRVCEVAVDEKGLLRINVSDAPAEDQKPPAQGESVENTETTSVREPAANEDNSQAETDDDAPRQQELV